MWEGEYCKFFGDFPAIVLHLVRVLTTMLNYKKGEYSKQPTLRGFNSAFWEILGSECFSAMMVITMMLKPKK